MVGHERVEVLRGRSRFLQRLFQRLSLADVHHEVERLTELLGDPRLIDDARIPFRAQVLDVVAETDARGQDSARDDEDGPHADRDQRFGDGDVDQLSGSE